MDRIWNCGAMTAEEVTGYADSKPHVTNYLMHELDLFMGCLQRHMPRIYRALVARHLRVVPGSTERAYSERRMAVVLYGITSDSSHRQFRHDCDMGYATLQIRLMNYLRQVA